jgi:tetratricopeptide (TPR) repeat protein
MDIDTKVKTLLSYFPQFEKPEIRAKAEELSALLVKAHPQEAKAYALYADVLYQQRKLTEAKFAYKKALELNSQVYLIWEQLLNIELNLNEAAEAVKDGEDALSIFPNQANLYFLTALAYIQTQKHEKAISYLKDALSLASKDNTLIGQIYSSLGDAFNSLRKYAESDQAYEKALEIAPDNVYALNNYAYYLSLRGEKIEKAEKMSKRSNELDPGNASFQDTYGWILFKQKKYSEARIWMEKALSNNNNNPTQIEHYGDILFRLGEVDKAVTQWQKAKQAGSGSKVLEKKINERKYFE